MANFVMVIQGVTALQLEKILEIQNRSNDKLRWTPQANQNHGVTTQNFQSGAQSVNTPSGPRQVNVFNNVRLEWDDTASTFAREVFDLFIPEHKQAQAG